MDTVQTSLNALRRAIAQLGSQMEIARVCGVTQPAVSLWLKRCQPIPSEHVLKLEAATGISRHELRPDIYPFETPNAPPAFRGVDLGQGHVSFQNTNVLQRAAALGGLA